MQLKDCCKLSLRLVESVKLGALRAKKELACQCAFRAYALTFQRVLCAYVLTCQRTLRSYMPTCLGCSLAHCQRALRACVLTWHYMPCVLTYSLVNAP